MLGEVEFSDIDGCKFLYACNCLLGTTMSFPSDSEPSSICQVD